MIRTKLKERKSMFCGWTSLAHPSITEIFSSVMKPDFMGIDVEHSVMSYEDIMGIIAAGQAHATPVLPRVASHNGEQIRRVCDAGADGIIVPMVSSPEEVRQIVEWMKYPPVGKRGYGVARAQGYGARFDGYTKEWNEKSALIIQIESIEAVNHVDAILDCEEIDGVMIGPYDIAGSLGIPGRLEDPKVLKACDKVIVACSRAGKACGTQLVEPDQEGIQRKLDQGYTFIALASDIFLLWKWSEKMHQLITHARKNS